MSQSSTKSSTSRPSSVAAYLEPRKEDESNYNYGWGHACSIADGKYGEIYYMRRNLRPDRGGGGETKDAHKPVAVKTLKLDREDEIPRHVQRETKALRILRDNPQNDHLIELLDWFLSDNKKLGGWHFCLVHPYISKDLYDIVLHMKEGKEAPWSEKRVKNFARQTLEGIGYLHGLRLVHRDIKADNILVKTKSQGEDIIKITDFGYAEPLPEGVKTKAVDRWAGTPEYCSPEQWKCILGYCCDIWSYGVTLLELCNKGIPPWEMEDWESISESGMDEKAKEKRREEERRILEKLEDEIIKKEPYWNSEVWTESPNQHGVRPYSTAAKDFIMKLLEKDHEKRLTATEALKSDWLNTCDDRPRERSPQTGEGPEHKGKHLRAGPAAGAVESRRGSYERPRPTKVGSERNGKTKRTASTASITGKLTEQMIGCSISRTNSPSGHEKINPEQTRSKKPQQKTKHDEKSTKGTTSARQTLDQNNNRHNDGPNQQPKHGKHHVTRK